MMLGYELGEWWGVIYKILHPIEEFTSILMATCHLFDWEVSRRSVHCIHVTAAVSLFTVQRSIFSNLEPASWVFFVMAGQNHTVIQLSMLYLIIVDLCVSKLHCLMFYGVQ